MEDVSRYCGFELKADDVDWDAADAANWERVGDAVECRRENWGSESNCIWHAETEAKEVSELVVAKETDSRRLDGAILRNLNLGDELSFARCDLTKADFTGSYLRGVNFDGARLRLAELSETDLRNSTCRGGYLAMASFTDAAMAGSDFSRSNMSGSDLSNAHILDATFRNTKLDGATMNDINGYETNFVGASLENATLNRVNLNSSNLVGAKLYNTVLENVVISDDTTLGDRCVYDAEFDATEELDHGEQFERDAHDSDDEPSRLTKAQRAYQRLEQLCLDNSFPEAARNYCVRRKEMRRKQYAEDGAWAKWSYATAAKHVMGFGENPWRVVATSLATIFLWSLFYPLAGIQATDGGAVLTYSDSFVETAQMFWKSLYFSTMTFTTLGYADFQLGNWARLLAMVESFVGALLMALLVFVLGRRTTYS